MGKFKKNRQKLHSSATGKTNQPENNILLLQEKSALPISLETNNIFAGLNIDLNTLNKNLKQDDTTSIKSFKSTKSEMSQSKLMTKKDKLKLKRELLLRKIDTVSQLKKEKRLRKKRKNNTIIGDTNPLHDALPSLESLLKSRKCNEAASQHVKHKAIQKSSKRKKDLLKGISIYKKLLKSNDLIKNPLNIVNENVKHVVEYRYQK